MTDKPTVVAVHPGSELFGSDRMFLESVLGLLASGARVVAALPAQGPLVSHLRASGAEVVIIPMLVLRKSLLRPSGWSRLFTSTFRGLGAAWRLIGSVRPTAVYVSTITLPEWPLVARMRRTKVISHVHEAEASASRIVNTVLYAPHLAAHRVVFNSRFSLDTAGRMLPSLARRGTIVYNGVAGPQTVEPARERIDGPIRILFVGRLSPRKGPDIAVEALRILGREGIDAELTLLGSVFPGYEWFEKQLREKAAVLSAEVRFLGFHADIWPQLAASDVLVVPSTLDEPFGNTAVEGLLAGRPVVASDTSGLREAAGGYTTARLVEPGDPAALAAAIREISDSWSNVRAGTADAAFEANMRHAPDVYRSAIATIVGLADEKDLAGRIT